MNRNGGFCRMHELCVTFKQRPSGLVLVSPDAPLSPFKGLNAHHRPSSAPEQPVQPEAFVKVGPVAASPEPKPVDPWQTEVGRQVRAEEAQIRGVLKALKTAVDETRKHQTDRLDQLQQAAVELALTIATKLLHQQIDRDEFPVESMVRDMADQLMDDVPSVVRLNPDDLLLLKSRLGDEPVLPGQEEPRLMPDPSLARGDCRVEGKAGNMRLSELPQHLAQIREDLLRRMGHAGS